MKRRDLLHHLEAHGCEVIREGGRHTMYVHRGRRLISAVPRHAEIHAILVRRICRDLGVPVPPSR